MSHSTGIPVSQSLVDSWKNEFDNKTKRCLKVQIRNDELVETGSKPFGADEKSDFDAVNDILDDDQPCYILYHFEKEKSTSDQWILILYVPLGSQVKEKMVYSATKDNVKQSLGAGYFFDEIYASEKAEVSWAGYQEKKHVKEADDPLTEREAIKKQEAKMVVDTGSAGAKHTVAFPLSGAGKGKLEDLKSGSLSFVELSVDTEKETIELSDCGSFDPAAMGSRKADHPRFYILNHKAEGKAANVFVYCCPDNAPVREKMLYSTVKSAAISAVDELGLALEKKLEVSEPGEVNKEYLDAEVFNIGGAKETAPSFAKPSRPGRGRARLHKGPR